MAALSGVPPPDNTQVVAPGIEFVSANLVTLDSRVQTFSTYPGQRITLSSYVCPDPRFRASVNITLPDRSAIPPMTSHKRLLCGTGRYSLSSRKSPTPPHSCCAFRRSDIDRPSGRGLPWWSVSLSRLPHSHGSVRPSRRRFPCRRLVTPQGPRHLHLF